MILSVENLTFAYGKNPILEDISFDIQPGRLTALLGVNGAGKTTLLKCCNRILRPDAGSVFLDKTDIAILKQRDIATLVGFVPHYRADVNISVFEMILMGRQPHSFWMPTEKDEQITEEIISLLGIEHLSQRPFQTLSGGESQIVLIGRAMAQEPRILLLDEPTSSLDPHNQAVIMNLLQHLAHVHQMGILAIIHDVNLAVRTCDQILMLKDKKIIWTGNPVDLTQEIIATAYGILPRVVKVDHLPVFVI